MKEVFLAVVGAVALWAVMVGALAVWDWQCKTDGGYPHSGAQPDCPRWCENE